jgi:hypothetical protein
MNLLISDLKTESPPLTSFKKRLEESVVARVVERVVIALKNNQVSFPVVN